MGTLKRGLFTSFGLSLGMTFLTLGLMGAMALSMSQPSPALARPLTDTDVGGVITQSTTWGLAGSPYILTDNVVVTTGVTLTIEPGVVVQGQQNIQLKVLGHLSALGTETQPLTFTSATDTGSHQWEGLLFDGGTGHLRHATVRYGGEHDGIVGSNVTVRDVLTGEVRLESSQVRSTNANYGLYVENSRVVVSDTTFANNGPSGGYALYVNTTGTAAITVTDSLFENNAGWAMRVNVENLQRVTGNSFSGNGHDRVRIAGGAVVAGTTLVPQTGMEGYDLEDNLIVPDGVTLTVQPGVAVMGGNDKYLRVEGYLQAIGLISQPITFTSSADDAPEGWAGLLFDGGAGVLRHAVVRFGGDDDGIARSNVTARGVLSGVVHIESSQVRGTNARYGMYVADSQVIVSDTLFYDNGDSADEYGLYATGAGTTTITVTNSIFENNGGWAMRVNVEDLQRVTGNQFSGNGYDRVVIAGETILTGTTLIPQIGLEGYELEDSLTVTRGVTLTVQSGVAVMGRNDDYLNVMGHLEAMGLPSQPITFTSSTDGGPNEWAGLLFDGGTGHLQYAIVRYGGDHDGVERTNVTVQNVLTGEVRIESSQVRSTNDNYGLYVADSQVVVSDTLFYDNGSNANHYALSATGAGTIISVTGNVFQNNAGRAMRVDVDNLQRVTGNRFDGNGYDRVRVTGETIATETILIPQVGLEGYEMESSLAVTRGVTLTVQPGVAVMGQNDRHLRILGHLGAVGLASQPITFTSATNVGPDEWDGLLFDGGTGVLSHATVRYGGQHDGFVRSNVTVRSILTGKVHIESSQIQGTNAQYGLYVENSRVVVSDTVIYDSGTNDNDYGLYAGVGSVVTITGSTFQSNNGNGVAVNDGQVTMTCATIANNQYDGLRFITGTVSIFSSAISDNVRDGLRNDASPLLDARYNWWGSPTGPTHASNPDGLGDEIVGNVLFDPWLKKAMCASVTDANLAVAAATSPDLVIVGAPLTYTFTITNYGPSPAGATSVTLKLTDTFPLSVTFGSATPSQGTCSGTSPITCDLGALAFNDTAGVTVVVTATAPGTIVKTARVTGNEHDPDQADNTAMAETVVNPLINLAVTKSGSSGAVTAGSFLTYTVVVTNSGPWSAAGVMLTDTLPLSVTYDSATLSQGAGCGESGGGSGGPGRTVVTCTLGTLLPTDAATVTIAVTVGPLARGMITNTVEVVGVGVDLDTNDNVYTETTTVNAEANLAVAKSGSSGVVTAGDPLTYTVIVANDGPSAATETTLTDTLPLSVTLGLATSSQGIGCGESGGGSGEPGRTVVTCALGTLAPHATATVTIAVSVDPLARGMITNTVEVESAETDPDVGDNVATETTAVNAEADLSVAKQVASGAVTAGNPLTYTVIVTNYGPAAATGVNLTDTLPLSVTLVSATPSQGTGCGESNGGSGEPGRTVITCALGGLAPHATAMVTIAVSVDPLARGMITNKVEVESAETDLDGGDNVDTETTPVYAEADLAVAKSDAPDPATVGYPLTYTVTVTNDGPSAATGVILTDTLPVSAAFDLGLVTSSQADCVETGTLWMNKFVCTLGILNSSGVATVTLVVTPTAEGEITNAVTVAGVESDPNTLDNTTVETTSVEAGWQKVYLPLVLKN
ncbi:MAG: hypothetical protein SXV54_23185 [Chloroflexota bacterium]|nr:hypothetical protein [Chloroflexota bacterium]